MVNRLSCGDTGRVGVLWNIYSGEGIETGIIFKYTNAYLIDEMQIE